MHTHPHGALASPLVWLLVPLATERLASPVFYFVLIKITIDASCSLHYLYAQSICNLLKTMDLRCGSSKDASNYKPGPKDFANALKPVGFRRFSSMTNPLLRQFLCLADRPIYKTHDVLALI
ncbi:hypothetical protein F5050DRAFT_1189260 [Lentinula boryana]|uniref:Uncharacterized protein n=1 Tax=Lentinula boryana TaxID=40481 RepID=A0ABQ8PYE1_9AGAR|nr:hypothetical protein F5050DRAFT_1189260 [Lentinula boryana]